MSSWSPFAPEPPDQKVYEFWIVSFTGGPEGETNMVVNAGEPKLNLAGTVLSVPFYGRDPDGHPNMSWRFYPLVGGRIASWQKVMTYDCPPHMQPGRPEAAMTEGIPKEWLERDPW